MGFSFIHAADLHLDSPLKGLAAKDPALAQAFHHASRKALDNLVEEALREPTAFVVIAGDIFDGDWKNYETGLLFERAMAKLDRAGIRVIAVRGNHDAESVITRKLGTSYVRFFGARQAESIELEEFGVVLHGHSFARRSCTENIAVAYPPARSGRLNIGVLHTSLAGADGHEPYAPCEIRELAAKGYAYWALGHVHKAAFVTREPWIVYPGNLQGRHGRETGPKGAVRVVVADGAIADVAPLTLDAARWATVNVTLAGCETLEQAALAFREALRSEVDTAGARPLAVRVHLMGRTILHGRLHDRERLRAELASAAAWLADTVLIEKIVVATTTLGSPEDVPGGSIGFLGILNDVADDPKVAEQLRQELADLRNRLPAELFDTAGDAPFDPAAAGELLRAAVPEVLAAIDGTAE